MPDTPRPIVRALMYRPTAFSIEWQVVRLDLVLPMKDFGWRLIGVDPCDEFALATWEREARIEAEQAARRKE